MSLTTAILISNPLIVALRGFKKIPTFNATDLDADGRSEPE